MWYLLIKSHIAFPYKKKENISYKAITGHQLDLTLNFEYVYRCEPSQWQQFYFKKQYGNSAYFCCYYICFVLFFFDRKFFIISTRGKKKTWADLILHVTYMSKCGTCRESP